MARCYKKIIFISLLLLSIPFYFFLFVDFSSPQKKEALNFENFLSLKEGDLILRLNNGLLSDNFRKIASSKGDFSHCGIIIKENNDYYIIHSEKDETKNFDGVVKEDFYSFSKDAISIAIYDIQESNSIRQKIIKSAYKYWKEKRTFDLKFNTSDHSQLYCSEFVALCYNEHFSKEKKIKASTKNPIIENTFFSLDDLRKNFRKKSFVIDNNK